MPARGAQRFSPGFHKLHERHWRIVIFHFKTCRPPVPVRFLTSEHATGGGKNHSSSHGITAALLRCAANWLSPPASRDGSGNRQNCDGCGRASPSFISTLLFSSEDGSRIVFNCVVNCALSFSNAAKCCSAFDFCFPNSIICDFCQTSPTPDPPISRHSKNAFSAGPNRVA